MTHTETLLYIESKDSRQPGFTWNRFDRLQSSIRLIGAVRPMIHVLFQRRTYVGWQ